MTKAHLSGQKLLPIADRSQTRRVLMRYARDHRGTLTVAILLVAVATAAGLVAPWVIGRWVDRWGSELTAAYINWSIIAIAIASLVDCVCTRFGLFKFSYVGQHVVARLRERVLGRVLHLPSTTLDKAGVGDVLTRTVRDVADVSEACAKHAAGMLASLVLFLVALAGLCAVDWRFAVVQLMISIPLYVAVLRVHLSRVAPLQHERLTLTGALTQAMVGSLRGHATVRAYLRDAEHSRAINGISRRTTDNNIASNRIYGVFVSRVSLLELVCLIPLVVGGFIAARSGTVSAGQVVTAVLYCVAAFEPVRDFLFRLQATESVGVSLARLIGVAEMPMPARSSTPQIPGDTSISFLGVSHRYDDGPEVLSNISLHIAPGERVALVGASGAGKTTLAGVGAGLLTPTAGSVLLGGVPLINVDDDLIRGKVGMVTQDVYVFSGPLVEDIRLANPAADDAQVLDALRTVGADSWIHALPQGMYTEVGELGHHLTPAQGQQLALARLVLADPPVAILDEATAEAGSAGARNLEQAAEAAIAGRTALVVAHRLTQAILADRIVVLDHGAIVEIGTHDDLVARGGLYSELWASWKGSSPRAESHRREAVSAMASTVD